MTIQKIMKHDFDVIIVGLGPAGSLAALLLEGCDLKVLAIDKDKDVYSLPRAVTISDQGFRIAQSVGIDDIYFKNSTELGGAGFVNKNLELIGGVLDLKGITTPNGWAPSSMFHQPITDKAIRNRLRETSATILLEHELIEIKDDVSHVSALIRNLDNEEEIKVTSRYLIGSDGGSSSVRKILKIDQEDLNYNRDWVVVDVKLTGENRLGDKALQVCDPSRICTYIPSHLPFRRWEFIINEKEEKKQFLEDKKIQDLISKWLQPSEYEIIRKAVYQFHSVIAESFHKGNCFLIGDAAHQNPPFMGEGMMSGYRDAMNLCWKISMTIRHNLNHNLIKTYQDERKPHAQFVVENSAGIGELMEAYAKADDPNTVPKELVAKGYGSFVLPNLDEGLFYGGKADDEMNAGQLFPQPMLYKNNEVFKRNDEILGKGFALISKNKIEVNSDDKEFLEKIGCNFKVLEGWDIKQNQWIRKTMEVGEVFIVRPDKYIFGCSSNKVSLETLIDDLRSRIEHQTN